jgi:hypothetical protein
MRELLCLVFLIPFLQWERVTAEVAAKSVGRRVLRNTVSGGLRNTRSRRYWSAIGWLLVGLLAIWWLPVAI